MDNESETERGLALRTACRNGNQLPTLNEHENYDQAYCRYIADLVSQADVTIAHSSDESATMELRRDRELLDAFQSAGSENELLTPAIMHVREDASTNELSLEFPPQGPQPCSSAN